MNTLLRKELNIVLSILKSQLEQNGYIIDLFENLEEPNIEINHIQYQSVIKVNKEFHINDNLDSLATVKKILYYFESIINEINNNYNIYINNLSVLSNID